MKNIFTSYQRLSCSQKSRFSGNQSTLKKAKVGLLANEKLIDFWTAYGIDYLHGAKIMDIKYCSTSLLNKINNNCKEKLYLVWPRRMFPNLKTDFAGKRYGLEYGAQMRLRWEMHRSFVEETYIWFKSLPLCLSPEFE